LNAYHLIVILVLFSKTVYIVVHGTVMQQVKLDDTTGVVAAVRSLQTQVTSILTELQQLTKKVKEDAEDQKLSSEWKPVAMVVDRLCFIVFSAIFVVVIVVIAPRL